MRLKRDWAALAAWAAIFVTLLAGAFAVYGRFTVLEARMDEADQDRHEQMKRLERIEQKLDDVLTWVGAQGNAGISHDYRQ